MTPLGVIASGALYRMVFRAERGHLTQSVILSPFASLRVNSAKNLVEILRPCPQDDCFTVSSFASLRTRLRWPETSGLLAMTMKALWNP
jgi:hypothetical protein